MLDPIADMLTRIRNAQRAHKKEVFIPSSKLKVAIAGILASRKFVHSVQTVMIDGKPMLKVVLLYKRITQTQKDPAIRSIRRMSKQGQRWYVKRGDIRRVKNGMGLAIISTSRGVMAGEDAYRKGLGGEYICEVW